MQQQTTNMLDDKVVIVTGGARGMGASHARGIVDAGGKVVITDVLTDEGKALAKELGDNAVFAEHDVTSEEAWTTVVALAEEKFGGVDGLVNNAGIPGPGISLEEETLESYDRIMNVNLRSVLLGIRAVAPALRRRGAGSIVNISSSAGLRGVGGTGAYGVSKWGVRGLTKIAAVELAAEKIRVNSVHPGMILTPMLEPLGISTDEGALDTAPARRVGRPEEITGAVLFLLSDAGSYTMGAELAVDGGWAANGVA